MQVAEGLGTPDEITSVYSYFDESVGFVLWNDDLQCCLRSVALAGDRIVVVTIATGAACHCSGAIKIAKGINPNVEMIQVFAGHTLDIIYRKNNDDEWVSECYRQAGGR
jgi:hypothetical protein